ncbi:amidohydrolase family protein [Rhodoplanes sp. Z2-YC6860]|uniref:amidohydrolase family protein n=1 Tax=Rhodoplanes sp. Z2-YC6860 TaxID=674703 RepID=UPI00078B1B6B|nr:amidohydrolase family protein [Rhodoplanes sp. Z2-YC6860]AMN44371.1 amidohydrolase [Rhodoplanes sp. Z2-YC6860]
MKKINRRFLFSATAAIGSTVMLSAALRAQERSPFQSSASPRGALPERTEFVIRNGHVLSMDPAVGELPNGDVHVRNGRIMAVGTNLAAPGARVIDGRGMIVMPGFIDTHWHLWNCNCRAWLRTNDPRYWYFPLTSRIGINTLPEDAYRAVSFGLTEALTCGITTVHNWCHNTRGPAWADAELSAMRDMGIRGRYSYGGPQRGPTDQPMDLADLARVKKEWFGDPATTDGRLSLGICSRNLVPGQSIRGAITFAMAHRDWGGARELNLPITLHASPKDLVFELEKEKLLGPDVQLVHPMFTVAEERAILRSRGTSFATSPIGEVMRPPEGGVVQLGELIQDKVLTSLSLDETVEGTADYFNVMRTLYKYHKHRMGETVPAISTKRMVELATIEGAKALGLAAETGSLSVGKRADLITVRTTDPNIFPMSNPWDAIVVGGTPQNVDLVVADGRIMRAGGKFTSIDQDRIMAELQVSNKRLAAFADPT